MIRYTIAAGLAVAAFAAPVAAQTEIDFTLDWRFEGPAAPYFIAEDAGHFAAEGLTVEITPGQGSLDAIPKVATGAYPIGFADMASLIKFIDQNPGAPVIGVMMMYDKPAFAIVGRKSLGIEEPSDLEGKVLGAPPPDGAWAQFPVFAASTGLDVDSITVEPVGFPTREPMLAEGQVAAVTGFSFTSYLNTVRLGVDPEDMTVLLMADYGLDLYGNVIIVNTEYAAANPEVITGFLRGVAMGVKDSIADPEAAVAAIAARNPALDSALEVERLEIALRDNIVTEWVLANGIGNIDADRFVSSLDQIAMTYEFNTEPDPALYFTDAYLPTDGSLMLE
ncbi:NitT/TauT family transport system substrate-binding protein [Roseicitreum antarcticum]|uniref:NitT/TauT family transport system substrate-binding protein n=1 Tax=Roseicitreum antarcticum TaxID=564137 RepID=A0A1H2XN68_9RHOB|nr:ABC transporter substrate-binding protein [Roseicitreum antarcticum]SDW94176.1 NitT/TauT family transport system substrate-binding protein [Roseicitreum antarcticum]